VGVPASTLGARVEAHLPGKAVPSSDLAPLILAATCTPAHGVERDSLKLCRVAQCQPADTNHVHDHLLIGTPGTPAHDGGVCDTCGRVLEQVVARVEPELSIWVEHAQHEADERDALGGRSS
jgi:hypothetical protein